ncbi:MAG: hypothetical protein HXY36_03325 [Chloroflexi bacterium]|nr:hypothetical protein [Chloroflexota bacterium]
MLIKNESILTAKKTDCQLGRLCALLPRVAAMYRIITNEKLDETLSARYN